MRLFRLILAAFLGLVICGCGSMAARRLLAKARLLETEGKYREAAAIYEKVGAEYSKYPEAMTALLQAGTIYGEKLCEWGKAVAVLKNLVMISEGKPSGSRALLQLGRAGEKTGSPFRDSVDAYEAVIRKYPGTVEAARAAAGLGRVGEMLGAWSEASASYQSAMDGPLPPLEKEEIWISLQGVWLWEALGAYFSGKIDEGVALAKAGLERRLSVQEVRRGLEELLTRYSAARRVWRSPAGYIVPDGITLVTGTDESRFYQKSERGVISPGPEGWKLSADLKKGSFRLQEAPVSATPSAGKAKTRTPKQVPWSFRSSSREKVLGVFWSADHRMLGWIGREKAGERRKRARILDLKSRKSWIVFSDASGKSLGEVLLFLPRGGKVVYPYGSYLVVADNKGGNMVQIKVRDDELGAKDKGYSGENVSMLACAADGLELFVSVPEQDKKKAVSKAAKTAAGAEVVGEEASVHTWKVNLAASE